jgi:hypothetical protein
MLPSKKPYNAALGHLRRLVVDQDEFEERFRACREMSGADDPTNQDPALNEYFNESGKVQDPIGLLAALKTAQQGRWTNIEKVQWTTACAMRWSPSLKGHRTPRQPPSRSWGRPLRLTPGLETTYKRGKRQ